MEKELEALVEAWMDGEYTMYDAVFDRPVIVWQAILRILESELTDDQRALLAAGPLETLLANHGPEFIDEVEAEARRNPRFNKLLGGVWRHEMPSEIWQRIERARDAVW
jgi:hypothetical protein